MAPGRAHLADQLDRPDVDPELQRGGGHQGPEVPGPEPGLHPLPSVLGEAAVVGGHLVGARAARPAGGPAARTSAGC